MSTIRTQATLTGFATRKTSKRAVFTLNTLKPIFHYSNRKISTGALLPSPISPAQSTTSPSGTFSPSTPMTPSLSIPSSPDTAYSPSTPSSPVLSSWSKETIDITRAEILDKMGSKSAGKIVATSGATATTNHQSCPGKIFTVRPIKSWIDSIANAHGSPGGLKIPIKPQKRELVLKTMQDSYTEIILPFKSDKSLLEEYINVGGTLRFGKFMEDLDALAGAIAYKHADDGKSEASSLTIVTASVDRIDLLKPLVVSDIRLSGHVSYVGFSSMEIFMKIEEASAEKPDQHGDTILVARFTMVARDSLTGLAAQVNPMFLRNETEKKLFQMGENHKARKRLATDSSLTKRPPTQEERFLIHDIFLDYSEYDKPDSKVKKPDNVEWMADTKMSAVHIMQPQDRNIHDKIFGGHLMRLAYELAFCNASTFISSRPTFLALDEISFRKPVPIGTFLALDSQIVYSEGGESQSFQVMVKADVLDIEKKTRETTNTFWFTFSDTSKAAPKIMPRTYAESMLYIEGQRRRRLGTQLASQSRNNIEISESQLKL